MGRAALRMFLDSLAGGLALFFLAGCTGGQTGEITRLSPCEVRLGELAFSEAGFGVERSAEDQVAEFSTAHETTINWEDETNSALDIELRLSPEQQVSVIGGPGCVSHIEMPVVVGVASDRLTADFTGSLSLSNSETAVAHVSVSLSELSSGPPVTSAGAELDGAKLTLTLELGAGSTNGLVWLRVADDTVDEIPMGSW